MKTTELNDDKSGTVNVALTRLRAFSVKMLLLLKIRLSCSVVLPGRSVTSKKWEDKPYTVFHLWGECKTCHGIHRSEVLRFTKPLLNIMEVLSSVSGLGTSIQGYNDDVLIEIIRECAPDKVFLAEVTKEDFVKEFKVSEFFGKFQAVVKVPLIPVGLDMTVYEEFKQKFSAENVNTPELAIKKNMLDLIDNTIFNYLAHYWKGPETVNSEVTDSLFRAKHKLFSSVFYDLEKGFWEDRHSKIIENIRKMVPGNSSVIISGVESRYWFKDHTDDLFNGDP